PDFEIEVGQKAVSTVRHAVGVRVAGTDAGEERLRKVDRLAIEGVRRGRTDESERLRQVIGRVWLRRLADDGGIGRRKRAAIHTCVWQKTFVEDVHRLYAAIGSHLKDLSLQDLHLHSVHHEFVRNRVTE